ncbi:MAG: ABC transporter permease subunit [Desulfobulbaceae bacterium]|nr:ABC transporter permease subunit [Desulfobulbaceae bacterium]
MDNKFLQRVRRKDKIAKTFIQVCGIMVIVCVFAILALIVKVTLPLLSPSKITDAQKVALSAQVSGTPLAIGIDSYGEALHLIDQEGTITFLDARSGAVITQATIQGQGKSQIRQIEQYKNSFYNILWQDSSLSMIEVRYQPKFDTEGKRTIEPSFRTIKLWPALAEPERLAQSYVRLSADNRFSRIDLLTDNTLTINHEVTTTDFLDNQTTENFSVRIEETLPGKVSTLALDDSGLALYAGTDNGYVVRWDLADNDAVKKTDTFAATENSDPIASLGLVFGGQSLVVGSKSGTVQTWMQVRAEANNAIKKMQMIHVLEPHAAAVSTILSSRRSKTVYSISEAGIIHADHMTSENHLFTIPDAYQVFGISQKDNALIALDSKRFIHIWQIDNPHPEASLKTLFGKVWYEGYNKPEYVWQSSSQSDDAEPKLSLIPLIFGTMKGTLYAMLFSIPLAIFGAVYTSQFTSAKFRKSIKPIIEVMASVPSVVIGFLIALWLAPIVERSLFSLVVALFVVPLLFTLVMVCIQPFYRNRRFVNFLSGYEFLFMLPVLFIGGWLAVRLAPGLESLLFHGNFKLWLYQDMGMRYDQRNCIIIAFGLGICVIPIIFSITEDAISNIPPSLTAASLALGASRWQTVWRVILPSASPGIFAAMIIGFGRAVGETMVVLMATGNTPIMDWSIFNGMRTLSANIAVEIPEAPFGGTLYRVLFLCATVLFALTFVLNTGAEIIREHLRKKYGRY